LHRKLKKISTSDTQSKNREFTTCYDSSRNLNANAQLLKIIHTPAKVAILAPGKDKQL
jgi:hypothetical protein